MSNRKRNRQFLKARQRYIEQATRPSGPPTMAIHPISQDNASVAVYDGPLPMGPTAHPPPQAPQSAKMRIASLKQAAVDNPDWESQQITAHRLGVSVRTLHRWMDSEGFPKPVKFGGINRFERAAVDQWIAKQQSSQRVG